MIQIATFTIGILLIIKGRMNVTATREIVSAKARGLGVLMILVGIATFFVDNIMVGVGGFVAVTLVGLMLSSKIAEEAPIAQQPQAGRP